MPFPFEVPFEEVETDLDRMLIWSSLALSPNSYGPKGPDFIEYPVFQAGYESLKKATKDFRNFLRQL